MLLCLLFYCINVMYHFPSYRRSASLIVFTLFINVLICFGSWWHVTCRYLSMWILLKWVKTKYKEEIVRKLPTLRSGITKKIERILTKKNVQVWHTKKDSLTTGGCKVPSREWTQVDFDEIEIMTLLCRMITENLW